MTESEFYTLGWQEMLEYVDGRVSDRKLRLFAVACARSAWGLLENDARLAVDIAENFADGTASASDLQAVRATFRAGANDQVVEILQGERYRPNFGGSCADSRALWAAKSAMRDSAEAAAWSKLRIATSTAFGHALSAELSARSQLLRDVVGPGIFRPIAIDPDWLTAEVLVIAQNIYQERRFDRMPTLADALEDASCDDNEILDHCRDPSPHVRGCWVVDLVLRKV